MSRIAEVVAKEFREALPATIFFLVLFHLIGLTKAVALQEYSFTALRAAWATIGALIVAKAILVVEALPVGRAFPGRPVLQVLWKTLLYSVVALSFRLIEELVPLVLRHGGLAGAADDLYREVSWPLFAVLALWIVGGLFLYCLAAQLVRAIGHERTREIVLGATAR